MRLIAFAAIYTALAFTANAAMADISTLRDGDMRKLRVHATAMDVPDVNFLNAAGEETPLSSLHGKVTVLNFWATWCAPCRKEMPELSALQAAMGGDDFQVVTIATGRNEPVAMKSFFEEIGVDNLPLHRDPRSKVARQLGVFGLPITLILDRSGKEVARLQGDANWNSDSARAIVAAVIKDAK